MTAEARCDETRELLPEVALGIADGEERARLLDHVAACPDCWRELERLSAIADELMALAPGHEPPVGFELRMLETLEPPAPTVTRASRRGAWVVAATALSAVAAAAGGLLLSVRDDVRVADRYRAALAEAHGSYFGATRLHSTSGAEGGVVFVYRGAPSWLMVTVADRFRDGVARAVVVGTDGRRLPLDWFRLQEGTWGGRTPVDLTAIGTVRLESADGTAVLTADLGRAR
jgi:hypothetical protein